MNSEYQTCCREIEITDTWLDWRPVTLSLFWINSYTVIFLQPDYHVIYDKNYILHFWRHKNTQAAIARYWWWSYIKKAFWIMEYGSTLATLAKRIWLTPILYLAGLTKFVYFGGKPTSCKPCCSSLRFSSLKKNSLMLPRLYHAIQRRI